LGRRGRDTQASLARAFASVGRAALPILERSRRAADARVRIHALAVIAVLADPDLRFDEAVDEARRASFGAHLAPRPGLHLP
ncbi:HEAT repeat domain-containing protein, partial [Clavibacter lycopersici]